MRGLSGRTGKNRPPVVIPAAATTNPSTLLRHPDASGFHSTRSPDSFNSEENYLEVTVAANNPSSSGRKYLTNRKTQRDMGETTPAVTVTSLATQKMSKTETNNNKKQNKTKQGSDMLIGASRVKFL